MNVIFLIDIIINFFSAYYDDDFIIVDASKVIFLFKPFSYRKLRLSTSRPGSYLTSSP